jgi:hypothetical protein
MKKALHLCTQTLLATGLFITSAQAEFAGWFGINNPGPGGRVTLGVGETGPVAQGNWLLRSDGGNRVEFQRSPSSDGVPAQGFTLMVSPGGTGRFEIAGDPTNSYQVQFTYNFGFPVAGNQAGFYDANGHHTLTGTGYNSAFVTPASGLQFVVICGAQASSAVLQVQDWQATVVAPLPAFKVAWTNNTVNVSWPSPSTGFVLQQNDNPANTNGWSTSDYAITDTGTQKSITIPQPTGRLFFRLAKP